MEIADTIRAARGRKAMSQRVLAKHLKVSPSAVAQWELGETVPAILNRVDLARLLDIPFQELVPEFGKLSEMATKDPQILAIVVQLQKLPPPVREAILMQTSAMAEALRREGPPEKPAPEAGPRPRR